MEMIFHNEKERINVTLSAASQDIVFVETYTKVPKVYLENIVGDIDAPNPPLIDKITLQGNINDTCTMIVCE